MYCDADDLISATSERDLIQLTDDEKSGSYNAERVDDAIKKATSEINGYCMVRYSDKVPFNPVPELVNSICVEIAIYILYKRRKAVDDGIKDRYEKSVDTLEKIAKGTVKLLADEEQVSEDGVTFTNKTSDDRAFKDPTGYIE